MAANDGAPAEQGESEEDPVRERLLEAAARVFAAKGYSGTKITDIIRESRLSNGAVYGRFATKNDLLIEAVVTRTMRSFGTRNRDDAQVADLIVRTAVDRRGPLSDAEAVQLEAYIAARRETEVADAIVEARRGWRAALQPTIDAARADGTVAPDADVDSILYFLQTVHLGLLVQRGAGLAPPDEDAWREFVDDLVHNLPKGSQRSTRPSKPQK